jgi:hypothetical protein
MYGFYKFIQNNPLDREIIGLYYHNPHMNLSEISKKTNVSIGEIYRILHANEINPNRLKNNHQKVHNLSNLGWGISEIASFTGYTPRNIRYILKK